LEALANVEDITRIVQKLLLGRGNSSDLLAVNTTIRVWQSVMKRVELEKNMEGQERGHVDQDEWASLDALMSRMSDLPDLFNRINLVLEQNDGGTSDVPCEGPIGITDDHQSDSTRMAWKYGYSKWIIKPE
jgi:DNA mismatch repair ATPase MutS